MGMKAEAKDAAWSVVRDMVANAKAMHYDGCHKIYLSMGDAEKAYSERLGYESHKPDFDKLREWYESSCGLEFVQAVFRNESDPNAGFVDLIPQGARWA